MKQTVLSPAKISYRFFLTSNNARFEVQKIDFFDEITVEKTPKKKISIVFSGPFGKGIPNNETSILYQSLQFFLKKFSVPFGVNIAIHKNIPPFSGLGSCDTNIASIILLLSEWANIKMVPEEFASFGIFVPFFLSSYPAAILYTNFPTTKVFSMEKTEKKFENPIPHFSSFSIPTAWWQEKMQFSSIKIFEEILFSHFPDFQKKEGNFIPFSTTQF